MSGEAEKELLLHTCCAPCAGGCVAFLLENSRRVALCYSNSNLMDAAEYEKRLASVRRLAEHYGLELLIAPYDHAAWLKFIAGLEKEPERGKRCGKCFEFSLRRTAALAKQRGENFSTTLTVSPHKNSAQVFAALGDEKFEHIDFKKGGNYAKSCQIAKELNFYRQKFCGCEFSYLAAGKPEREA